MALPIEELRSAWNALASRESTDEGWLGIEIASAGRRPLMAARHFPGNSEALLAGFGTAQLSPSERLPEGAGFEVSQVDPYHDQHTWIALSRKESGSPELFGAMVADVVAALGVGGCMEDQAILATMLRRIRMWQAFMARGSNPLGPQAEVGLFGELALLEALLDHGVEASSALRGWVGCVDGVQDFLLGNGAIEVKSTLATSGFRATIGSLEQLDDSLVSPIFLAAHRLSPSGAGAITLSAVVARIADRLSADPENLLAFQGKMLAAGFHESYAPQYTRPFRLVDTRLIELKENVPRLVRGNVPPGVIRATYEIDLDGIPGNDLVLDTVLKRLGVVQ